MHVLQRTRIDPAEIDQLMQEIDDLIKNSDHLLSPSEITSKFNEQSTSEAIAKALRTMIERGRVEITKNLRVNPV